MNSITLKSWIVQKKQRSTAGWVRILFTFFCIAIIAACSLKRTGYGPEYNPERAKRGVSLLPEDWERDRYSDEIRFTNPNKTGPRHSIKSVLVDSKNAIIKESDTFYSGKSFKGGPEQDTLFETIIFTYDYGANNEQNRFNVTAILPPHGMTNLSVAAADEILGKWGLTRAAMNPGNSSK
jgi:hypothetical protein